MMEKFPFSKDDFTSGKSLFEKGCVGQVIFSEGTYQIEVNQGKEQFWPFLQLSDAGEISDCFCSCSLGEGEKSCPHLAAAFHRIFLGKKKPLHVRFRESLFYRLADCTGYRQRYETLLKKVDGKYVSYSSKGKVLFSLELLDKSKEEVLRAILEERDKETEETSLKFSNLSQKELSLWKEGRPGRRLRFELSFWSDLAKWWFFLLEEGEPYSIVFSEEEGRLPKKMFLSFSLMKVEIYISQVYWKILIPVLGSVNSSLKVFALPEQMIRSIVYDEEGRCFYIGRTAEKRELFDEREGIPIGDWRYIKGKGFYLFHTDPLLEKKVIKKGEIAAALKKHASIFQMRLEGTSISLDPIAPRYHLFFDKESHLHCQIYLFEKGDLQYGSSEFFFPWVYLSTPSSRGFYLLKDPLFKEKEKVVIKEKIPSFIERYRTWLNGIEGFSTHISNLTTPLQYEVSAEGTLCFGTNLDSFDRGEEIIDFGNWVYIQGEGFYEKERPKGVGISSGMEVEREKVSSFIAEKGDDLEQIPNFFAEKSPLKKVGVEIRLTEKEEIEVIPSYDFLEGYDFSRVQFFGDFTYVPKEGFYPISSVHHLPSPYRKKSLITPKNVPLFMERDLKALQPYLLTIDPRLEKASRLHLQVHQAQRDKKKGGWLFDMTYATQRGEVSLVSLWEAIQEKRTHFFSSAGYFDLTDPRFAWLCNLSKKNWAGSLKKMRLSSIEWARLQVLEEVRDPIGESSSAQKSRKVLEAYREMEEEPFSLEGFKSTLRPYQEKGLSWLWFLYCQELSGLLCDEMGLGKTHQAMGLIAAVHSTQKFPGCKYLVVCPTSVIYHWEDLLHRFLPSIRVRVFHSFQRTLDDFANGFDLLLTSYGMIRSEEELLTKEKYTLAIFDEVQIAKNSHSKTHRGLQKVEARMLLGLTGTPIENRLSELKALFDLLLPTYFPPPSVFKKEFTDPIERNKDPEKRKLLARLINPFLLRRQKREVLTELPEKIEEIAYCRLSQEQEALYQEAYRSHREIIDELRKSEKSVSYLPIFSLISTLKQICDHPVLIDKEGAKAPSGKWDLFIELLEEARESGQKVVVFSHYLEMLDHIQKYLKKQKISFAGIRGSTRDRRKQVEKFQKDPSCEVFVASLQAAGVGIDLTAASIVIHYDRWWNPAKENQATDRVHRMGQNRGVQVFKLVTKDTIEEHIHKLIEKKKELLESVVGFDSHSEMKTFSREELITLLELSDINKKRVGLN